MPPVVPQALADLTQTPALDEPPALLTQQPPAPQTLPAQQGPPGCPQGTQVAPLQTARVPSHVPTIELPMPGQQSCPASPHFWQIVAAPQRVLGLVQVNPDAEPGVDAKQQVPPADPQLTAPATQAPAIQVPAGITAVPKPWHTAPGATQRPMTQQPPVSQILLAQQA